MTKYISKHMKTAFTYAELSTAKKLKCGALLVSADNTRILSLGYNGTPSGSDNTCERVKCSNCGAYIELPVDDYQEYFCPNCNGELELETKSNVIHAEMNCLMYAARNGIKTDDCILYCTHLPCANCAKHIVAAGIKKVFYGQFYKDYTGRFILEANGVEVSPCFLQ